MNVQKTGKHKLLAGLLAIALIITCLPTMNCTAETTSSEQQFQELYLRLLETGDTSVQDISTLNLPYMTCYNIMNDVKNNAGYLPYQCYTEHHLLQADSMETVENTPYLRAFHLTETKNKTYYVKVRAYKKDSKGKKIYGSYSTVKKIKIKK